MFDNLKVTYLSGELIIDPKPVTVELDQKEVQLQYSEDLPEFTSTVKMAPAEGEPQVPVTQLVFGESFDSIAYELYAENITPDPDCEHPKVGVYEVKQEAIFPDSINPENYLITYINSNLTINKKLVTITFDEESLTQTYDALPKYVLVSTDPESDPCYPAVLLDFEVRYDGYIENPVNADSYTVEVTIVEDNYEGTAAEILEILQMPITITADNNVKNFGDVDPELTWTITEGSLAGSDVMLSGSLIRETGEDPGFYAIYENIPFDAGDNYFLTFIPGTFYINPYGPGTKKIKTYLDCVEEVTEPGSAYPYIAYFRYENGNPYDIYIQKGSPENIITGDGSFDAGNQPELFLSGGGSFTVPFDGNRIVWSVASYETNNKTAVSSDASSTSGRCQKVEGARMADATQNTLDGQISDEILGAIHVYPNPVKDKFIISFTGRVENIREIGLIDSQGRSHAVRSQWITTENGFEVDLSQVNKGIYLIRLDLENKYETFRVIKE
jgi:hypothetical protein